MTLARYIRLPFFVADTDLSSVLAIASFCSQASLLAFFSANAGQAGYAMLT